MFFMELNAFLKLLVAKRQTLYGVIALFLVVAALIIAFQPFKYSSKAQLLVVQESSTTIDAYTASKSSEYLSGVLASVVTSNSFYTKVMESGFGVNADYFGDTPKEQMKAWEKTVSAKSVGDSGIIVVTVYHPDRAEAEKILRAVNFVFMTQHSSYHGSGNTVKVRLIDQPVTSAFPVQPNIPLIAGLALLMGALSGMLYIYLLNENAAIEHYSLKSQAAGARLPSRIHHSEHGRQPHNHTNGRVRGQAPAEAVAIINDNSAIDFYYEAPVAQSPYGHHSVVSLENNFVDEPSSEAPPEVGRLHGDMRRLLH